MNIEWEPGVGEKFKQMMEKIPVFLRPMAEGKVTKGLEKILKEQNRTQASEKDMVDAFFAETPFGFHGPMKSDMQELGIDYTKYGHPK